MIIKKVKLSELKNNTGQIKGVPKNPRFIRSEKYEKLVKSLQDDPEMIELREIVAYDNNGELVVIMGNMRLRGLKEIGVIETTIKILPIETPPEKLRAYTIKDNIPYGENDWDTLANFFDEQELTDWGMDLPTEWDNENETDYSDKNKEIDTNEFSDKMELKLLFSSSEFQFVLSELSKIDASKENALLKLLNYEL